MKSNLGLCISPLHQVLESICSAQKPLWSVRVYMGLQYWLRRGVSV